MMEPIPVAIWPHVFAKASNEVEGIYFLLTEMPHIMEAASL